MDVELITATDLLELTAMFYELDEVIRPLRHFGKNTWPIAVPDLWSNLDFVPPFITKYQPLEK